MSPRTLVHRVLLNAFRPRPMTITNQRPGLGLESLEDRTVPATITVNSIGTGLSGAVSVTNNDYTLINNAIQNAQNGDMIVLNGTFNWAQSNAATSWKLGSDGIAGTGDDYSINPPPDLNNITLTAAEPLGGGYGASILGPTAGEITTVDSEGFLYFDNTGVNQGWTISNLDIERFDSAIQMYQNGGPADSYTGTTITNNKIVVPADVDTTGDPSENVGIYLGFGTNQTVANNLIQLAGTGASLTSSYASSIGIETQPSPGSSYDNLQITGNTIQVVGAQNAKPEVVIGVWENGNAHGSNITISGNSFTNLSSGNSHNANLQRAFRITSQSSGSSTVTYSNNTVSGADIGFQWLPDSYGADFISYQPVQLIGNTITDTSTGVQVQSNGAVFLAKNTITDNNIGVRIGGPDETGLGTSNGRLVAIAGHTAGLEFNIITGNKTGIRVDGAGAIDPMNNNNLSGNTGQAVVNNSASVLDLTGNWWGTTVDATIGAMITENPGTVNHSGFRSTQNNPVFTSANNAIFSTTSGNSLTITTAGNPNVATMSASLVGSIAPSPTGATAVGTTAIITTTAPHNLLVGSVVTISGVGVPGYNGTFTITAVPSSTTFQYTVGASGLPVSGGGSFTSSLPAWLTFTDNANGTGTLSGTPPAGTTGVFGLQITANNGFPAISQAFALTTIDPPTFTSLATLTVPETVALNTATPQVTTNAGTPTSTTLTATLVGGGDLPPWLTFTDNTNGTGTFSGTPPAGATYNIVLTASNGPNSSTSQNFTLTVTGTAASPPVITNANSTTFNVGAAGTFAVTTTGSYPTSPALTASLGGGIADSPAGATEVGTTVTITTNLPHDLVVGSVVKISGLGAGYDGTFTVTAVPSFTTFKYTAGVSGLAPSGGGTILPSWLTFTDNGNDTGTFSGTPPVGTPGALDLTINALNTAGLSDTQAFTLFVTGAPTIPAITNPPAIAVGATVPATSAYTFSVTGFPFPTITATAARVLPSAQASVTLDTLGTALGITFTDNGDGTATIGGTPNAGTGGTYTITISATNGTNPDPTPRTFTLTINEGPTFTSTNNLVQNLATTLSFQVAATPGFPTTAATIAVIPNADGDRLPPGVLFNPSTRTLTFGSAGTGFPTKPAPGVYTIRFQATNSAGLSTPQDFTLTVEQKAVVSADPTTPSSATNTPFLVGRAGDFIRLLGKGFPADNSEDILSATDTVGGVVTITTSTTHNFLVGSTVTISGMSDPGYNGTFVITAVTTTSFQYNTVGGLANATGGTATGQFIQAVPTLALPTGVPPGLTLVNGLDVDGNPFAVLQGTPTQAGSYSLQFKAANKLGVSTAVAITVVVNQTPSINVTGGTTATTGNLTVGTTVATSLPALVASKTGFPVPTFKTFPAGTLPPGVTFSTSTGKFSGTPTASGIYPVTITATNTINGVVQTATYNFTFYVSGAPVIKFTNPRPLQIGMPGSLTIAVGYPYTTITTSTNLAGTGLTFHDNGDGTATLSGTPTGTPGTKTIVITAPANGFGANVPVTTTLTYTVNATPVFLGPVTANFTFGVVGTSVSTITGFPAATVTRSAITKNGTTTVSASLLPMTISRNTTTGVVTVTLKSTTSTPVGTYTFTLNATNGIGLPVTQLYTITVA